VVDQPERRAVLLASIAYTQISEVFPSKSVSGDNTLADAADAALAIALFPNPLPQPVQKHPLFPALSTAVRDLANDNVMTAVMLTGIMLLQVREQGSRSGHADHTLQAGRYYAKKPSSSSVPSGTSSGPTTPPQQVQSLPVEKHSPIAERAATPFRELTEEEAMELNGFGGGKSKKKNKKR
jgi:hypothetical protein